MVYGSTRATAELCRCGNFINPHGKSKKRVCRNGGACEESQACKEYAYVQSKRTRNGASTSTVPAMMRAAVYHAFGGPIVVEQVPRPKAPDDGVLLEVKATGVCRSDWHGWKGHDSDIVEHGLPFVPGHESSVGWWLKSGGSCRSLPSATEWPCPSSYCAEAAVNANVLVPPFARPRRSQASQWRVPLQSMCRCHVPMSTWRSFQKA